MASRSNTSSSQKHASSHVQRYRRSSTRELATFYWKRSNSCKSTQWPHSNSLRKISLHTSTIARQSVFPELSQNFHNITWLSQRAILAPTNDTVDFINDKLLDNIGTHKQIYTSIDKTADVNDAVNYSTEFLNSLNSPGMPPHKLRLKIGSPIILLRNLDPPKLCNGTKLIIKQLRPNIIEATIAMGQFQSQRVFIPRIPLTPSNTTTPFKRLQFPVCSSFAMTINKQILDTVGLSLITPCFSHGQFYVGCSRVSSSKKMFLFAESEETANVVYSEVLS